jgi:hypothetical protein
MFLDGLTQVQQHLVSVCGEPFAERRLHIQETGIVGWAAAWTTGRITTIQDQLKLQRPERQLPLESARDPLPVVTVPDDLATQSLYVEIDPGLLDRAGLKACFGLAPTIVLFEQP